MACKAVVQNVFKRFGLRLTKYKSTIPGCVKILNHLGVSSVFDVGANEGQFARELKENGFSGKIISFEPTRLAHARLLHAAQGHQDWTVHPRAAVGAVLGRTKINVAGNSAASSSILDMGQTHLESAPDSAYIAVEEVDLITIDSVIDDYATKLDETCIKIDVQGYEDQVLQGAQNALQKIRALKLELSLVSLYEDDKLYTHYFERLEQLGFSIWDLEQGHRHPDTGRLLNFDALFVRD